MCVACGVCADDATARSATQLAALIRERSVTSADVVEAFIQQVRLHASTPLAAFTRLGAGPVLCSRDPSCRVQNQRVNEFLNAVCATRYDEARLEAAAADEAVAAWHARGRPEGELPPFTGVPCSVKECFAVKGMPHTSGLVSRVGTVATQDATVVARYRAAGLIPLCVTNVSELCMWYESSNKVRRGCLAKSVERGWL